MKKIIPALALLLISAVVMTTASFAWFSLSATVTAKGMEIKARAGSTLLIAPVDDSGAVGTFGVMADYGMTEAVALQPTSIANLQAEPTNQNWYKGEAPASDKADADVSKFEKIEVEALDQYRLHAQFKIYSVGGSDIDEANAGKQAYVKAIRISSADGYTELLNAVRVAVVYQNQVLYVTGNQRPTDGTQYVQSITPVSDGNEASYTPAELPATGALNLNNSGASNAFYLTDNGKADGTAATDETSAALIHVYIWYEGQDASCFTNAVVENALSVEIDFQESTADNAYDNSNS